MKKYKLVRQDEFQRLKLLQEAGISVKKAADVTGRSITTMQRIYRTDSFPAYQAFLTKINAPKQPVAAPEQSSEDTDDVMGLLKRIDARLETLEKRKFRW